MVAAEAGPHYTHTSRMLTPFMEQRGASAGCVRGVGGGGWMYDMGVGEGRGAPSTGTPAGVNWHLIQQGDLM